MSTPVTGPLSVTPLYAASGDRLVWWDGVEWQQITVSVGPPATGGAVDTGGGGAVDTGGGGGVDTGALRQRIMELEARIAALEGK